MLTVAVILKLKTVAELGVYAVAGLIGRIQKAPNAQLAAPWGLILCPCYKKFKGM